MALDLVTGRLHVVPGHGLRISSMLKTVVVPQLLFKYGAIVPEKMKETQDPWMEVHRATARGKPNNRTS